MNRTAVFIAFFRKVSFYENRWMYGGEPIWEGELVNPICLLSEKMKM
jgi:hypothetical protein